MRTSPAVVSMWARRAAGFCVLLLAAIAWVHPAAAQTVTPAWATAFGASNDFIQSTAGDADGNVYIAGYMSSASMTIGGTTLTRVSGTSDMVVAKLDANGATVWAKNFGGATATTVRAYGVAVDSSGNVYLAGYFQGAAIDIGATNLTLQGTVSTAVAKLNAADGSVAWAVRFGNTGAQTVPSGIALDSSNNPVVAGYFTGNDTVFGGTTLSKVGTQDLFVAKLATGSGAVTWATNFGGTSVSANTSGLGLDTAGNIYTFGYFTGGNMSFGLTTLTLDGARDFWLSKLDSSGAPVWARNYGGTGVSNPSVSTFGSLAVDGSGNSYFASSFHSGSLVVGSDTLTSVGGSSNALQTVVVAKVDTSGTAAWARSYGTAASNSRAVSIKLDTAGNPYVTGYFTGATLSVGGTTLTRIGSQDAFVARYDTAGNVIWAQNYGGIGATVAPVAVATGGTSNVVVGGNFTGAAITFGATSISPGAGQTMFLADLNQTFQLTAAATGTGTVTSTPAGISCGATCTAQFNAASSVTLTAVAGTGYTFSSWSGDCSGTTAAVSVTMSAARSCTATFTATGGGGGGGSTPTPPPAPPPFVNTSNPPPTVIAADTTGSGQGTVSFASSFANPGSLSFTASQTSGAALPSWLTFDPSSVSFNYNVPLPPDLPIQPSADASADATARAVKAGRSIVNTVYPLAVLVQTIPVSLTATGGGQTYSATINMDFYAPRSPVAITAVSYAAGGASGDAASARPALSWDGGQVVFETAASNISAVNTGGFTTIARYHGLSGRRDLLSQTAIPGGGVANAADGNSNNPAVSAAGNYAAFSSAAPSVSATPSNRLRQVYRTSLAFPRVALNEAATPAAVMVSATAAGVAADAAADMPSISEQGDFVAFESAAANLGTNPNRVSQIWRKDVGTGAVVLVSSAADGAPGNGDSRNVSILWDGNFAVFDSTATNLLPGTSGRHIYLKNLISGQIYRLSQQPGASNAKVDARLTAVVYTSVAGAKSQVLRYDIPTGVTSVVSATPSGAAGNGDSNQPSMSADGRFVAFHSTSTDLMTGYADNGQAQIWVRDVLRGVTALVTQTEAGAPGNGASSDPAVSGDGSSIGFASQSTNLVNGTPRAGQIHLAGNPLVLPGRTAYWYTTDGGNQTWSIERWGAKALVAGLAYTADGGTAVWAAGNCQFTGLTCQGTVSQWSQAGAASTPVGAVTLSFASDGRTATVALGTGAARNLALYPVGGSRTTGFAGLPQNGYWGVSGNAAGVSSLFIDTDTQASNSGASVQSTHVTLFGYDASGNAQWYAAEGTIGSDNTFSGQLYLYSGGSSWTQGSGSNAPSAVAVGTLSLNFTATDRATALLPNGRTVSIGRWRF